MLICARLLDLNIAPRCRRRRSCRRWVRRLGNVLQAKVRPSFALISSRDRRMAVSMPSASTST
jgi:hypothetical protein